MWCRRMVWETKAELIVMLTKLEEHGRRKGASFVQILREYIPQVSLHLSFELGNLKHDVK